MPPTPDRDPFEDLVRRGDEDFPEVIALAAAVVRRAFQDLTIVGEPNAEGIRRDAYHFLTHRLWDPASLWCEIIGPFLHKRTVVDVVNRHVAKDHGVKPLQ